MSFMRTLRKLVLGETWTLPGGVALAVGVAGLIRAASGPDGWWRDVGGVLLGAMLVVALGASLGRAIRSHE